MRLEFEGDVIEWRGPAPYYYVEVPEPEAAEIAALAPMVSYGWGVIPVTVKIGGTTWTTSLFPKGGGYLVPIKVAVRRAEGVEEGGQVSVRLDIAG